MRRLIFFLAAMLSLSCAYADDKAYDAAARKVKSLTFIADKGQLLRVLASAEGTMLPPDKQEILVDMLNSPEFERLWIAALKKTFSEPEMESLAQMMDSPAFRLYQERMPSFIQSVMPEAMAYFKKGITERLKQTTPCSPNNPGPVCAP